MVTPYDPGGPQRDEESSRSNAIPVLYALYTGDLYGTERMAMATLAGLGPGFAPAIIARPGPATQEARRRGLRAVCVASYLGLAREISTVLSRAERVIFLATRFEQSLVFWALNLLYRRRFAHFVVVHGGGGKNVYWRNRMLLPFPVDFVAISDFVRNCLVENGVPQRRITVIENFLSRERIAGIPTRAAFERDGVRKVLLITRVVDAKRVDLLLDCLAIEPRLSALSFRVYGDGEALGVLARRASRHSNVVFAGFDLDVVQQLREHDLLLHTAPLEPFGLVILEAMAAGVPVLVPSTGAPASMVADGDTGFVFAANSARDLADRLLALMNAPAAELRRVSANASRLIEHRFAEQTGILRYRELLLAGLAPRRSSSASS